MKIYLAGPDVFLHDAVDGDNDMIGIGGFEAGDRESAECAIAGERGLGAGEEG